MMYRDSFDLWRRYPQRREGDQIVVGSTVLTPGFAC